MKHIQPHDFFRLDFDQILEEGRRQETMLTANKGEYAVVKNMHSFFQTDVLPRILDNDWVYESTLLFAQKYALENFRYLRVGSNEVFSTQQRLGKLKAEITSLLKETGITGIELVKMSDFFSLLKTNHMPHEMQIRAKVLYEEAKDHEQQQLLVVLRTIRDNYETTLPRIMFVVRRAMKVNKGILPVADDNNLTSTSDYISWYSKHVPSKHPLYPVLGRLSDFYKVARNVASHHQGFEWKPGKNEVVLRDKNITIYVEVGKFLKNYRYLVLYLCELGVRGILSAFCEREQGPIANNLVREYIKIFPEDFPIGEPGVVHFYSE